MSNKKQPSKHRTSANKKAGSGCPATAYSIVEVRINGKLHDFILEGPEHAVRNALTAGGPYQEARVVENPRKYDFAFLDDLILPPNDQGLAQPPLTP